MPNMFGPDPSPDPNQPPKRRPQPGDPDYQGNMFGGDPGAPPANPGAPDPGPLAHPMSNEGGPSGLYSGAPGASTSSSAAPRPPTPNIFSNLQGPSPDDAPNIWAQRVMAFAGPGVTLTPEQRAALQQVVATNQMPGSGPVGDFGPGGNIAPEPGAPPPGQTIPGQAKAASTYSATPGAAPGSSTTNQGSQDVYRNTLLDQATQNPIPDVNDPAIAAQLNPAAAAIERSQRDAVRQGAEESFAGQQDYGAPEKMAAAERAGQQKGLLASDLVGRELSARRDQVRQALSSLGSSISDDQRRALEEKLQTMDMAIRQKGLEQTGQLGSRELGIRERLGMGGLNNDLMRTLLAHKLGNNQLGAQIGFDEASLNNQALRTLMGQ